MGPPSAEEFLRRFLLHVVPRGFMRARHYGGTSQILPVLISIAILVDNSTAG